MAMSGAVLTSALKPVIKTEIEAVFEIVPGFGAEQLEKFAQALANAIGPVVVDHIVANAVITSTVVVTSVSGVTTGGGVSGPGAGTATGTIA